MVVVCFWHIKLAEVSTDISYPELEIVTIVEHVESVHHDIVFGLADFGHKAEERIKFVQSSNQYQIVWVVLEYYLNSLGVVFV